LFEAKQGTATKPGTRCPAGYCSTTSPPARFRAGRTHVREGNPDKGLHRLGYASFRWRASWQKHRWPAWLARRAADLRT